VISELFNNIMLIWYGWNSYPDAGALVIISRHVKCTEMGTAQVAAGSHCASAVTEQSKNLDVIVVMESSIV